MSIETINEEINKGDNNIDNMQDMQNNNTQANSHIYSHTEEDNAKSRKQTLSFQTEIKQLLNLMINSLYSNKEIFLRELISNASDAIDKLRFLQGSETGNQALLSDVKEPKITISFDKNAKTLTISDNGVGMTYEEVIENIGTIAKSGTKAFLEKLSGDKKKDANLIGQFGVGFYSAFIVATMVELRTRRAGVADNLGVSWISDGFGEYTINYTNKEECGTEIVLHLKDDCDDLLSDWQIKSIIRKYSDHINYPIEMQKAPETDKDGKEIINTEFETVNKASALWIRSKNDISDDEYKEFYKHISHDYQEPLAWTHSKVEGSQEYTQLLYIPSKAPFDLYDPKRKYGVKLYVKRVFIMDDAEKILPNYLRFVRGVVDSQDLPLNVSREILQTSKDVDAIRAGCIKKILGMLEDMAKNHQDKYRTFWGEFGNVLKEGLVEDYTNKDRIAKLCHFASTRSGSDKQDVSLDDYVGRMINQQDKIYYITAENYNAAISSPHIEIFKKHEIEVLLLTDRIDEWVVGYMSEYQGKQLISVASGDIDLAKITGDLADGKQNSSEEDSESTTQGQENSESDSINKKIIAKIKDILSDKVKDVVPTKRLIDSACCLVHGENAMSAQLERMLRQAGQSTPQQKLILEVNLKHKLLQKIADILEKNDDNVTEQDQETISDVSFLLFEQATISQGQQLSDPANFLKRINRMIV